MSTTTTMSQERPLDQLHQTRQIKGWFEKAVPSPTDKNVHTQIGVHLEEVSEMVDALRQATTSHEDKEKLSFLFDVLDHFQGQFKAGKLPLDIGKINRVDLLDALCDQVVTSVGIGHMTGLGIERALQEVADSNDSKFGPDGEPVFNEDKKIMKGPDYYAPDLTKHI